MTGVSRRWLWFWVALGGSVAVTAALWFAGLPGFFLFLAFPLLFFPRRGPTPPRCPACGRPAAPGDRFCPRDGTPLGGPGSNGAP